MARQGEARNGKAWRGSAWQGRAGHGRHGNNIEQGENMSNKQVRKAKQFALKRGSAVRGVPAQVVGDELTGIYRAHGKLTGQIVVEAARPESAPLHPAFEWDDSVAGERWREYEARTLIKQVSVVQTNEEQKQVLAPVFYHVPQTAGTESAYHMTEVVVEKPDMLMMALGQLQSQMSAIERSIDALKTAANQRGDSDLTAKITLAAMAFAAARDAIAALH